MPFDFQGYNAMTDTVEDLLAAGVIDPAKVTRNGLQNACSIAGGCRLSGGSGRLLSWAPGTLVQ